MIGKQGQERDIEANSSRTHESPRVGGDYREATVLKPIVLNTYSFPDSLSCSLCLQLTFGVYTILTHSMFYTQTTINYLLIIDDAQT